MIEESQSITVSKEVRKGIVGWIVEVHNSVILDESFWTDFVRRAGCAEGKMPVVLVRRVFAKG